MNNLINKKLELQQLIDIFLQKGGKINEYYLKNPKKGPSLVFFKKWYRGRNLQDAITRSCAGDLSALTSETP